MKQPEQFVSTCDGTLPEHLLVSTCDGTLHDTRWRDWARQPLRANYERTVMCMTSLADVKATLRAGEFAWPGAYQMYLVTNDGGALCFDCARKKFAQIAWDWLHGASTGWRVIACAINYENPDLVCDHCNYLIPAD